MAITSACGPHCGIRANAEDTMAREAHCPCDELCHKGDAPPGAIIDRGHPQHYVIALGGTSVLGRGTPMCSRWYEKAGAYRPWEPHEPRVLSGVELVSVEFRPDAVPYEQTPASDMANDRRAAPAGEAG